MLILLWTWNYRCKLEIVFADGSTFVVTMHRGKIIDGELSIFFLWNLITQTVGTSLSKTMIAPYGVSRSQVSKTIGLSINLVF
jgi:hypothetical protein